MNVLGISGLNDSEAFKRQEFPELPRSSARICQGFDAAAALLTDRGVAAAAAEERFSRIKATGAFPVQAIQFCLRNAGIGPGDIDVIAHGFDYRSYQDHYAQQPRMARQYRSVYSREAQIELLEMHFPQVRNWADRFVQVPHHVAHAASAYYPSGFDEALIIVADGMGEHEGLTIAVGEGDRIRLVQQIPSIHSLGIFYSLFTMYLGFEFNMDEYKVMGLAPYGDPRRHFKQVMSLITLHDDGTHTIPLLFRNVTDIERETYGGSLAVLTDMFGPARLPEAEITRHHHDIAAALQAALQTALLHLLRSCRDRTGAKRLAMAGGVALNCTANGVIKRSGLFRDMFVQPAAGDDGTALGAALFARHQRGEPIPRTRQGVPLWGPDVDPERTSAALAAHDGLSVSEFAQESQLLEAVAGLLDQGSIVGWCQGRMEFGPRALGARSIIADPRDPQMRARINALVKKREDFRPFAPAVIASAADQYFDITPGDTALFEHMLCVTQVREPWRERLPAITHVDGSARVQTVSESGNGRFYRLLAAFGERTGLPMLLNTSFNVRGQPIVCNEREAVQTFLDAGLDALVIGDRLVRRADSTRATS